MAVTTSQITITTMEGWYSGDTAPSNPLIGDLWLDTTTNEIKKWDGTNWVKQADTQGPQGPKGDSIKSRDAYWIKSSTKPDKPTSETIGNWTPGSEPPETVLNNIGEKDKFWRAYKITYSNGENEYSEYSEVELIGSYEVLNGLVQFRNGVTTTENIGGQDVTVIDGGKILTGSIEANKMSIKDLSALKAKIGGFNIGENSIYSGTKNSIDSTERGIYFDSNGQSYFGDNKNFIRFYRSDKDNYKLQISADSLTFGSGISVEKSFEDIKGDIQNAQSTAVEAAKTADQANGTLQEKTPEWDANSSAIDALIDGSQPAGSAVVAEKDADGYDLTDARKMATNFLSIDSRGLKIQNEGTGAYQIVGAHDNTLYSEDDEMIARFGAIIELFANSETAYSGDALAYITGTLFHITHAEIVKEFRIGNFSFIPRSDGNMALKFMG